jgi:TonB family protein
MTAALLYRRRQRWHIWVAFGLAAGIHMVAVAIAENRSHRPAPAPTNFDPVGFEVQGTDTEPEQPPPEAEIPLTPDQPPVTKDETFTEDNPLPPQTRLHKKKIVAAIASNAIGRSASSAPSISAKALALSAPRPEYPYEARRQRTTGSGIAELTVDPNSGNVIDVRMSPSTGSAILDNAAVNALRHWRFKSGDLTTIHVPITFTLTGAVY